VLLAEQAIAAVQIHYNVLDRRSEAVLEHCDRDDIAFIPWRPIAPWRKDDPLDPVAKRPGMSRTQLALAWLVHAIYGDAANSRDVLAGSPGGEHRRRVDQA
jgi:diketogulonate reductase-like aldo/keto reductase